MAGSDDRRKHPRLSSSARIAWTIVGRADEQIDRLRDVSGSGALVASASVARAGDELRFDLLDDDGERFASGLARVVWVDPARGMGIAFSALGIDLALVASLAALPDEAASAAAEVATKAAEAAAAASAASATAHRKGPPPLRPRARAEERRSSARASDEPPPAIHPLEVRKPGVIIGIDLGTTNTCASYVQDGKPVIIPGRTGTNTIPSMITFDDDGTAHVGQRAADRQVLYPLRTVYGSKRLVGRTYRAELAAELQRHFAYPLAEAEGQRFGVRIDDRVVSMDEVAARVLEEVRTNAEEHLNAPVEAAVITVPAYFSEVQREAVRRAAADAKLVVHRIVNEPTAAAVAYGHKQAQKRARV
ncbi:MAG: Hsp70 family protein, partial [Deltaproteobacteria bacterium]|nr:Hsp70 family protein [Deltaproteobacteria bacterium]